MTNVAFAGLPKITQIRVAAVAVLKLAATIAGNNIIDTPIDEVLPDNFPMVAVFTDLAWDPFFTAGGIPGFKVRATLTLVCATVAAAESDAILQADILAQQARTAVLCDPTLMSLVGPVAGMEAKRGGGRNTKSSRYVVSDKIDITLGWEETFTPNTATNLATDGTPQAARRAAIAPLTGIANQVAASPVAPPGTYSITLTGAISFQLTGPAGTASGTVGAPCFKGIGFTLAAGSAAFAAGDNFSVLVVANADPLVTAGAANAGNGTVTNLVLAANLTGATNNFT